MTWARLDENFPDHPKVEELSDAAFRAFVTGLCLCNRYLTDGVLTRQKSAKLASAKTRQELVTAQLWIERDDGGIDVHDFNEYNRDAATVKAERKRNAERQARLREQRRNGGSNGVTNAATDAATNGVSNTAPIRSVAFRPEPGFDFQEKKPPLPTEASYEGTVEHLPCVVNGCDMPRAHDDHCGRHAVEHMIASNPIKKLDDLIGDAA